MAPQQRESPWVRVVAGASVTAIIAVMGWLLVTERRITTLEQQVKVIERVERSLDKLEPVLQRMSTHVNVDETTWVNGRPTR